MEHNLLLKENRELKESLARRLRKYGLVLMPSYEAESHGEHPNMNYVVWIVYAKEKKNPKNNGYVVMFPKAVYWLEDPTEWNRPSENSRIFRLNSQTSHSPFGDKNKGSDKHGKKV